MPSKIVAEETIVVGTPVVLEGASPAGRVFAVFEDNGETGYFYAVEGSDEEIRILDAVHIYNCAAVKDGNIPSVVQIVWSADGLKALLVINRCPHAAFDFEARRGYCRTGFPPPSPEWATGGHAWDDAVLALFR